ncbi:MAG TPA: zinc-ribbon domain-containing protein [Fibrobacteria bacterium]|nr:zinc-ribbon domain-containing protein [Fibrobacteria bacterium]
MARDANDWVACPHCGERIDRTAKSCRHCGSDDNTGWSEATYLDGLDLPEEGEYEDGLEAEGFKKPAPAPNRVLMGAVSVGILLVFALWLLRGMF